MPDIGDTLQKKIGPLPAYAWLAVVGGGIFFARKIGSVEAAEDGQFEEPITEDVSFPGGQLRPVVGEHFSPGVTGPLTIPFPETGGIVIPAPGEEPIIVKPIPSPALPGKDTPSNTPSIPSFFWWGRRWRANQRSAFASFIRSRKPRGYRNLNEWINGVPRRVKNRRALPNHRTTARKMGWI